MPSRAAVLIGTATYAHFDPVPAAANSLQLMRELLTGPLCGWRDDQVMVLVDENTPGDIPARLVEAFEPATDLALFYFVGHGQPDSDDHLCLALTQTRREPSWRRVTSLDFEAVRHAMRESRARFKVILLDCCFSGLAVHGPGTLGPLGEEIDKRVRGTGACVVAACGAYASAWYEQGKPGNPRLYTHFTRRLAEIVRAGPSGGGDVLTLGQLTEELTESLAAAGLPVPTALSRDQASKLEFVRYDRSGHLATAGSLQDPPEITIPPTGLPRPIRYDAADTQLPARVLSVGSLLPDVPTTVWAIPDVVQRARELLAIGYRLAEADPGQARRIFAVAERALHEDIGPGFVRYRLLLEAAKATRSSLPDQARRFLGLAAAAYGAAASDPMLTGAADELRRVQAALASP